MFALKGFGLDFLQLSKQFLKFAWEWITGSGEHLSKTRAVCGADRLSRVIALGGAPIHAMLSIRHWGRSVFPMTA